MSTAPVLLMVRGNSASGKTTAVREVRRRYGVGVALLQQDYLRREVLREHGGLGEEAVAPGFIAMCARHLLCAGYHVIVEGILHTGSYGPMLRQLITDHPGPSHVFYLDVGFAETVRRHHRRAKPIPVTVDDMRGWFTPDDVLGVAGEHLIPECSTLEQTVTTILDLSGLAGLAPKTPCPTRCARCINEQATGGGAVPSASGCDGWGREAG